MSMVLIEKAKLKLVLEALESERMYFWNSPERIEKAITAIKEALAQPKQQPDYKAWWKEMCERCDELDKKLARQEQNPERDHEPMAWPCVIESADFEKDIVTLKMQSKEYKVSGGVYWLYFDKPQRMPLTGYINSAGINANDSPHIVVEKLERAIEVANGIKGDA